MPFFIWLKLFIYDFLRSSNQDIDHSLLRIDHSQHIGQGNASMSSAISHLVIPFHPRQLPVVLDTINLWNSFPPFFKNNKQNKVNFVFFPSSKEEECPDLRSSLNSILSTLDYDHQIIFGNLTGENNDYYHGSRLQFEIMLSGKLLVNPSHVLYFEPDCRPVRPGWLSILLQKVENEQRITQYDPQSSPSNPKNSNITQDTQLISTDYDKLNMAWVTGSIFRGDPKIMISRYPPYLLHINGNSLYDLSDGSFATFYFYHVRPYIREYHKEHAYDTDMAKFALDVRNHGRFLSLAPRFQFTDLIQNHWHSPYSVKEVCMKSAHVVIVHGGIRSE